MRISSCLSLFSLVATFLAACSSSSTSTSSSSASGGSNVDAGSLGEASTDDGSITSKKDSAADTGPVDPCAGEASMADCQLCCATANKDAYLAFQSALLGCACKAGVCQTECAATACATPTASPDAACTTCLNGAQGGACKSDIAAVCTGAGACVPFYACAQKSCAGKT